MTTELERMRLVKEAQEVNYKLLKSEAGIFVREFLLKLINEQGANLTEPDIAKLIKGLKRDIARLKIKSQENSELCEVLKIQYQQTFNDNQESDLPEDILKISKDTIAKIENADQIEQIYLKQKALCEEIDSIISKLQKITELSEDQTNKQLFEQILQELLREQTTQKEILGKNYTDYDQSQRDSLSAIADLMDALHMLEQGTWPPKEKI